MVATLYHKNPRPQGPVCRARAQTKGRRAEPNTPIEPASSAAGAVAPRFESGRKNFRAQMVPLAGCHFYATTGRISVMRAGTPPTSIPLDSASRGLPSRPIQPPPAPREAQSNSKKSEDVHTNALCTGGVMLLITNFAILTTRIVILTETHNF